jgi:hypothetical protein
MSWTPPFHVFQPADSSQSSSPDRQAKRVATKTSDVASTTLAPAGVPFEAAPPVEAVTPAKKSVTSRNTTTQKVRQQQPQHEPQLAKTASPAFGLPFTPNPAPTITLPVTLGALELSFADGQSQPASASEDLPDGQLNHHQAAKAIGISPALLACYVSIFRSLGGRLEYSAEDLRTNKHALQPRYDKTLIEGFRDVRAQVRAGADIRSAMAIVTAGRIKDAETTKSNSKSKSKRSTAKLEALTSVNASLSKEIAALQAELEDLKGGRSKPFSA